VPKHQSTAILALLIETHDRVLASGAVEHLGLSLVTCDAPPHFHLALAASEPQRYRGHFGRYLRRHGRNDQIRAQKHRYDPATIRYRHFHPNFLLRKARQVAGSLVDGAASLVIMARHPVRRPRPTGYRHLQSVSGHGSHRCPDPARLANGRSRPRCATRSAPGRCATSRWSPAPMRTAPDSRSRCPARRHPIAPVRRPTRY